MLTGIWSSTKVSPIHSPIFIRLLIIDTNSEFGCYINRHGLPSLNSSIVRWEVKADAFAERWEHILLFSAEFIEIRHKATGRLVQVIEGRHIRLLNIGPPDDMPLIVARLGTKNDQHGQSDELFELLKTSEISTPSITSPTSKDGLWTDWDMWKYLRTAVCAIYLSWIFNYVHWS